MEKVPTKGRPVKYLPWRLHKIQFTREIEKGTARKIINKYKPSIKPMKNLLKIKERVIQNITKENEEKKKIQTIQLIAAPEQDPTKRRRCRPTPPAAYVKKPTTKIMDPKPPENLLTASTPAISEKTTRNYPSASKPSTKPYLPSPSSSSSTSSVASKQTKSSPKPVTTLHTTAEQERTPETRKRTSSTSSISSNSSSSSAKSSSSTKSSSSSSSSSSSISSSSSTASKRTSSKSSSSSPAKPSANIPPATTSTILKNKIGNLVLENITYEELEQKQVPWMMILAAKKRYRWIIPGKEQIIFIKSGNKIRVKLTKNRKYRPFFLVVGVCLVLNQTFFYLKRKNNTLI